MPNSPNGRDEDAASQKGPRRKPSASLQPPHIQPFSENEVKFRTSSKHKYGRRGGHQQHIYQVIHSGPENFKAQAEKKTRQIK